MPEPIHTSFMIAEVPKKRHPCAAPCQIWVFRDILGADADAAGKLGDAGADAQREVEPKQEDVRLECCQTRE